MPQFTERVVQQDDPSGAAAWLEVPLVTHGGIIGGKIFGRLGRD